VGVSETKVKCTDLVTSWNCSHNNGIHISCGILELLLSPLLPTGHGFTDEVNRVLISPPGFHSCLAMVCPTHII
jgi:hypothetical protein